jgi:hypothetical protein
MEKITKIARLIPLLVPALALIGSLAFAGAQPVAAFDGGIQDGANSAQGKDQPEELFGESGVFKTVTNVMLYIVGAVSVIMLIIGGIRYVVSGGDQNAVTGAKNTILYAIVGIVVSILAFAAVNFVVGSLSVQ